MAKVWLAKASTPSPTLTTAGKLRARAIMAEWAVGPPTAVQKPSTRSLGNEAVSDGERSCATKMMGWSGQRMTGSAAPTSRRNTR